MTCHHASLGRDWQPELQRAQRIRPPWRPASWRTFRRAAVTRSSLVASAPDIGQLVSRCFPCSGSGLCVCARCLDNADSPDLLHASTGRGRYGRVALRPLDPALFTPECSHRPAGRNDGRAEYRRHGRYEGKEVSQTKNTVRRSVFLKETGRMLSRSTPICLSQECFLLLPAQCRLS